VAELAEATEATEAVIPAAFDKLRQRRFRWLSFGG